MLFRSRRILMIKAHSMGIGDILRSSAAWRALKDLWPEAELHLLFLSRHEGYPSEVLISQHHLLSSATFLTIRKGDPHDRNIKKESNWTIFNKVRLLAKAVQPDLIIDFEWAGCRTSIATAVARMACGAKSLGINQFPLRKIGRAHV